MPYINFKKNVNNLRKILKKEKQTTYSFVKKNTIAVITISRKRPNFTRKKPISRKKRYIFNEKSLTLLSTFGI